ncbi:MAG: hypothetical protein FJX53_14605, partial [Alphaproteobacteria bacterium]|nr:hypothetical protein [Alphaproteobacteria bacterium]
MAAPGPGFGCSGPGSGKRAVTGTPGTSAAGTPGAPGAVLRQQPPALCRRPASAGRTAAERGRARSIRRGLAGLLVAALLGGCGTMRELPDISELDRKRAIEEIGDAGNAPQPSRHEADQNRQMVMAAATRLGAAAAPVCAQAGRADCSFDVQFRTADTFNAYAMGKNRIVMFDGFVRVLESEDECAAVMAHEMGHHIADHIGKGQTNAAIGGTISMVLVTALQAAMGAYGGYASSGDIQRNLRDAQKLGEGIGALSFS